MSSTVFCCDAEEPLCGEQEGLLSSLGVQHVAGQKQLSDSGSPKTPASPRRPDTSSLSTSSGLGNIASEGSTIHLVPIGSPSVASMVMSDHSFSGSPGTSWVGVYASSPSRSQNPIGSPVLSNAVAILPESTGANHEQFAEITANDVNLCRGKQPGSLLKWFVSNLVWTAFVGECDCVQTLHYMRRRRKVRQRGGIPVAEAHLH